MEEKLDRIIILLQKCLESEPDWIAMGSLFIAVLALVATVIFNCITHKQYIDSLAPQLSFGFYECNGILILSVKNTGNTYAEKIKFEINSLENNGDRNNVVLDKLFENMFDLYPGEYAEGIVGISGANICNKIAPILKLTVSYIKGNTRRKEKVTRIIVCRTKEQMLDKEYDLKKEIKKISNSLESVMYSENRMANYIEGRTLFPMDKVNVMPKSSLYKDMKAAMNNVDVVEKAENTIVDMPRKYKHIMRKRKKRKTKIAKKGQQKNQEKNRIHKKDECNDDKEQRRATRMGSLLAIIAIAGTICTIIFNLTKASINIWQKGFSIYYILQILLLSMLSAITIIIIRIVSFVFSDLKRYNINDDNYKKYDKESDDKYALLIIDFKRCMKILIAELPLFEAVYYISAQQVVLGIVIIVVIIIVTIVYMVFNLKKVNIKEFVKREIIHICVFVGLIIIWYIIIVVCIADKAAEVTVSFEANGNIEICHTSANDYDDVKIEILDANGETIYEDKVEKKEVLFAREDTYVSNEYVDAILVESELIHWKYIFCSEEIIKKSDQYCMCLTIGNGDKKIVLLNMFEKKDDKYLFAKKSISKKY